MENLFSEDLREVLKINQLPESVRKTSFHDLIMLCYKKLENNNYTFKDNEKYPFLFAIIEQQESLFLKAPLETIKRNYIFYSLHKSKEELRHIKAIESREVNRKKIEYSKYYNGLINSAIDKLNLQINANDIIKKTLLSKLMQQGADIESLDTKLNKIALDPTDRENMHLLYAGHCQLLMATLQAETATRDDILTELDQSIGKLSSKRAQTYYFFAQSRRTELEATIQAYKDLKLFMQRQGTKITQFKSESPVQYALLIKNDKQLLEKLLQFSNQSFFLKDEKLIAGDVSPQLVTELSPVNSQVNLDRQNSQNLLIDARLHELGSLSYRVTPIRAKKIALLNELSIQLETNTLTTALRSIQKNPRFSADYYLLHEGRTGKMVNQLSQLDMTKKDILQQITLELLRLKSLRCETMYFFVKSRKSVIEERIQACSALKQAINANVEGVSINAILSNLDVVHRACIHKHESALISKLLDAENTKACVLAGRIPGRKA